MGIFEDKLFSENDKSDNTLCNGIIISIFKNIFYYLADNNIPFYIAEKIFNCS